MFYHFDASHYSSRCFVNFMSSALDLNTLNFCRAPFELQLLRRSFSSRLPSISSFGIHTAPARLAAIALVIPRSPDVSTTSHPHMPSTHARIQSSPGAGEVRLPELDAMMPVPVPHRPFIGITYVIIIQATVYVRTPVVLIEPLFEKPTGNRFVFVISPSYSYTRGPYISYRNVPESYRVKQER
ncbi:hypothetical protein OG21DRAFT_1058832 [Imleria badia]|jgi:hypothetical protein|nr:hypothetical protein OG21DRAFT_1058832 [Imleria badia]